MRFKLLLLFFFFSLSARGQHEVLIKDLIESLDVELADDFDLSEFTAKLEHYIKRPVNLNKTDAATLKDFIFLSSSQISNLLIHISLHGKLLDVNELQSIEGWDLIAIERLQPFVTVSTPSAMEELTLKSAFKLGRHDLILRYSQVLETQKGFTTLPGSRYLGSPGRALLRYSYHFADAFSASLIMEKDAGEPFGKTGGPIPVDFLSGNISIHKAGIIKKAVLGDYSLQFGQGLTLWSGFSFGKGPELTTITKKDTGLKPYSSSNEYSFLRGLAAAITIRRNFELTPFISLRKLDAALSPGPGGEDELTNVNQTGLHRTQAELRNQNSLTQLVYGGTVQFDNKRLSAGFTVYQSRYSNSFATGPKLYDQFSFKGKDLLNAGAHYNYTYRNLYLFGEVSKSYGSGLAYLNGVLASLSPAVSLSLLYRDYDRDFHNFFNQAISESTEGSGEKGFYAGLNIIFSKKWALSVYADRFEFSWLKFRVDAPSGGNELMAQAVFSPTKTFRVTGRYKSEIKAQNSDAENAINYPVEVNKESYRLSVAWKLNKNFSFQNSAEIIKYLKQEGSTETGYMFYQDCDFRLLKKLSGNIRAAFFNTDSYNARIYTYESDVLYGYSFGMYTGKGIRSFLNLKYNLVKKVDLWVRYAVFVYPGNATVGSGLDEIRGNRKQEMKVQLRYQF